MTPSWSKHVIEHTQKLFSMDSVRMMKLLELTQFSFLYLVVSLLTGIYLNKLFADADKKQTSSKIFAELIGQSILIVLAVFYIRKIVKIFPVLHIGKYQPYTTTEYEGEIMIGLIFVATQTKILDKVNILNKRHF